MKCQSCLCFVLLVSVLVNAVPAPYLRNRYVGEITSAQLPELPRAPYHAVMLDEYHDFTGVNKRPSYVPELSSVGAFMSNGAVHMDYLEPKPDKNCLSCGIHYGSLSTEQPPVAEITEQTAIHVIPNEELDIRDASSTATEVPDFPEATTQIVKTKSTKPNQRPIQDDSDEDENGNGWPFARPNFRGAIPTSNAFFPIMFGYPGFISRSGQENGYPGGAIAIANSFSTGRGGMATSHATANGDPSTFQKSNWKRKSQVYEE